MAQARATPVSISPLLLQLANPTTTLHSIQASEIAGAVSLIFNNNLSDVQTGCLLYALHTTQLDRRPDILAACAESMRGAAAQTDVAQLQEVVRSRGKPEGDYHGGLVWNILPGEEQSAMRLEVHARSTTDGNAE